MFTGRFVIGEVVAAFFQDAAHLPVDAKKIVAGPAGHEDLRKISGAAIFFQLFRKNFCKGKHVHIASFHFGKVAETGLGIGAGVDEGLRIVGPGIEAIRNEGGREGSDPSEGLVVFQAVPERAVSAHGKAADEGVLSLVGEGKERPCEFHELSSDEFAVIVVPFRLVHVEAVFAGGHDDGKVMELRIAHEVRAEKPVILGAVDAVE